MKTRQKVRRALILASLALLPVTLYYFSPVLSASGAALGIVTGSLLVFAALFVSSLFVGRLFCGWACPVGGLQEAVALARGRPVRRKRIGWIKWVIWAPWAAGLVFLAVRAGGFTRFEPFYQTWHGISVGELPGLIAYVAVVALFADPVPGRGTEGGVPHRVLDGPVHGHRQEGAERSRVAFPAARRTRGGLLALRHVHLELPHEHRGPGAGREGRPRDQRLYPVRILRGQLPEAGHRLQLQQREGIMRLLCRAATCAVLLVLLSPLLPAQQRSLAPDLAGFGGPHYKLTLLNGAPGASTCPRPQAR